MEINIFRDGIELKWDDKGNYELKPGNNLLGIAIKGKVGGGFEYIDFKYFNVVYNAPATPARGPVYRLKEVRVSDFQVKPYPDTIREVAKPQLAADGASWVFTSPAPNAPAQVNLAYSWKGIPQTIELGKDVVVTLTPSGTGAMGKESSFMATLWARFMAEMKSTDGGAMQMPTLWRQVSQSASLLEVSGNVTCKTLQGSSRCDPYATSGRIYAQGNSSVTPPYWDVSLFEYTFTLPAVDTFGRLGPEFSLVVRMEANYQSQWPPNFSARAAYSGKIAWVYQREG